MSRKKVIDYQLVQFGRLVIALRKRKGFTSAEKFAYQNEINRVQYGRYENGSDLRLSSFFNLLIALDISPAEFFSEGFDMQNLEKD